MNTSPEAKQAAEDWWNGNFNVPNSLQGVYAEGYDAATAKLRESCRVNEASSRMCEMGTKSCIIAHQQPARDEQQYLHIERYFPKGYNPNDEPWRSISKHYRIAEKQMAVLQRMLSDKDKESEGQPDPQQPSATTPDVEKIATGAIFDIFGKCDGSVTSCKRIILAALAQAREPLVKALEAIKDAMRIEPYAPLHSLDEASINAALTGTEQK